MLHTNTMSKESQIKRLMAQELPSRTYQKRLSYRTSKREVQHLFKLLNEEVFNNKLPTPEFEILPRCRKYWGYCVGLSGVIEKNKSSCLIRLSDKWFCKQWLIATLAHEMCHQYQWDVESFKRHKLGLEPLMSHGPSFFIYKQKLKEVNIPLKRAFGMRRWFRHQNLYKC
jgi:hypothetical protein